MNDTINPSYDDFQPPLLPEDYNGETVPYEDHIIPSSGHEGAQGLSGLFDFVGEIAKDSVGLIKAIASDIKQLGQEFASMTEPDTPHDLDRQHRLARAEEEWQRLTQYRDASHDRDLGR